MLGNWMPSSRDRFTAADFCFLSDVLAPGEGGRALVTLWEDPQAMREMLDLKEVLRAVLDSPRTLEISASLYFYVLVRHAFMRAGLGDAALADYVAGVLAEQVVRGAGDGVKEVADGLDYAVDFHAVLETTPGAMRFYLQVAAGNRFLVLTGLYAAFLEQRARRRGAPGVEFYEGFARQLFREAADNRQAPPDAPRRLLGELSDALPDARRSLNRVAGEFVFLGE
jgi:hypothetical protein